MIQKFIADRINELEKQVQEFREYTKAPYIGNNHPWDRKKDAYIQKTNSCNACITELKNVLDFINSENSGVVSPSSTQSGVYTMLENGTSAEADAQPNAGEGVKSPLGKRTEDGNDCDHRWERIKCTNGLIRYCGKCNTMVELS